MNLLELAPRLGLTRSRDRAGPCPVCKADRTKDRRLPLRLTANHWWCNACSADGSAIALVAWTLLGRAPAKGDPDMRRVYDFVGDTRELPQQRAPEPTPRPAPPVRDLRTFLRRCSAAAADVEVADYLRGRGIDPALAPAGSVPRDLSAPFWPRAWSSTWRCVVPAFDVHGLLANIHARAVVPTDEGKTRWAAGLDARGLVFANRTGRGFLRGEHRPAALLFTEGLPDFLDASAQAGDELAVLSVESGSAQGLDTLAGRLPGIRVYIGTHDDPAGNRYEQAIATAIAPHPYRPLPLHLLRRRAA